MTDKPSVDVEVLRRSTDQIEHSEAVLAAADLLEEIAEAWEEYDKSAAFQVPRKIRAYDRLAAAIGRIHDGRD